MGKHLEHSTRGQVVSSLDHTTTLTTSIAASRLFELFSGCTFSVPSIPATHPALAFRLWIPLRDRKAVQQLPAVPIPPLCSARHWYQHPTTRTLPFWTLLLTPTRLVDRAGFTFAPVIGRRYPRRVTSWWWFTTADDIQGLQLANPLPPSCLIVNSYSAQSCSTYVLPNEYGCCTSDPVIEGASRPSHLLWRQHR